MPSLRLSRHQPAFGNLGLAQGSRRPACLHSLTGPVRGLWTRLDLNQGPAGYEPAALTTAPQVQRNYPRPHVWYVVALFSPLVLIRLAKMSLRTGSARSLVDVPS